MFGPNRRSWAAYRLAGAMLAVGLMAAACGGTASTTASSAGAAVSSAASAVGSAADAAGSKLASAADKATSAAASAASAASSKVSAAVSSVKGSGAAAATGPAAVGTASTSLGVVLVGANGMTLYMFDADVNATPTCYDKCAAAWPPLLTSGAPTATGQANSALLKTVPRTDGGTQVVYGQWPLYFWAKDAKPGDVTGQGVQGTWWVVGVDGQPIKTAG